MESAGIKRAGRYGIGNFGYPVTIVGIIRQIVYQPEAGIGFSPALQGEHVSRLVVGDRFVVAVGIGGKRGAFAVCGGGKAVESVVREVVSPLRGFVARFPLGGADVAVVDADRQSV